MPRWSQGVGFTLAAALAVAGRTATGPPDVVPSGFGDGTACVGSAGSSPDTAEFARSAVRVLAAAGHDPRRYTLELRFEDASTPYAGTAGGDRVTSAIFLPRDGAPGYAVRVNTVHPCVLTWVWRPARFTPWQRRIIERAERAASEAGFDWTDRGAVDIRVLENDRLVGVHVWAGDTAGERSDFHYEIDKTDPGARVP